MTSNEWIESVVATLTPRPCLAEYQPGYESASFMGGVSRIPPLWLITIKGVEQVVYIQASRVTLRDEEHVKAKVLACLPESERPAEPKPEEKPS